MPMVRRNQRPARREPWIVTEANRRRAVRRQRMLQTGRGAVGYVRDGWRDLPTTQKLLFLALLVRISHARPHSCLSLPTQRTRWVV